MTSGAKVAMLVFNPCAPDSRVEKEARALVEAGYQVRIFCLKKDGLPDYEIKAGVEYVRLDSFLMRWAKAIKAFGYTLKGVLRK